MSTADATTDSTFETIRQELTLAAGDTGTVQVYDYRDKVPGFAPEEFEMFVRIPTPLYRDYLTNQGPRIHGPRLKGEYDDRPHPYEQLCYDLRQAQMKLSQQFNTMIRINISSDSDAPEDNFGFLPPRWTSERVASRLGWT